MGGIRAALPWCDEWCAGAAFELEVEVRERQLRLIGERRFDLAGGLVELDLAGGLGDDAWAPCDEVDRDQRVERVLVRCREIDCSREGLFEQRGLDRQRSDLRAVWAC